MQLLMHYQKQPDTRGKRPGLPVSVLGLLIVAASCKLEGALGSAHWSWLHMLWPLWLALCCVGAALSLGFCCGLPLILRSREVHSRNSNPHPDPETPPPTLSLTRPCACA